MRVRSCAGLALCAILAWLAWPVPLAGAQTTDETSTCVACHAAQRDPRLRAPAEQLAASVHGKVELDCHDCHGGRPDEPTARAHDRKAGFRPGFVASAAPDAMLAVCGPCHATAEPARHPASDAPAPADGSPLERYLASRHAKALAEGRTGAATCADCHGAHDVRAVDDPESRVTRRRLADTCAHCHSDAKRMDEAGLGHDALAEWQASVHGRRFAAETGKPDAEARHAPTCSDCHGSHAIEEGERGVAGCERCHGPLWNAAKSSPHAATFERWGFLPCVDCHGSHGVREVSARLVGVEPGAACHRCHAPGQKMFASIEKLSHWTREAEALADRAAAVADTRQGAGLREVRHGLRLALHTLDLDAVEHAARKLRERSESLALGGTSKREAAPEAAAATAAAAHSTRPGRWAAVALLLLGVAALLLATRRRGSGGAS